MDSVLEHNDYCGVFIDEIVVFSMSLTDHIGHVNAVLRQLTKFNFKIRLEKCKIGYSQVSLLGHVVGGRIRPDSAKTNDVWKAKKPSTGKELQSFLGTINYLRDYVPRFSELAKPLNEIRNTRGSLSNHWGTEQDEAFSALKEALKNKIDLHIPDFAETFYVATDASNVGVLYQKVISGGVEMKKIISIASKSLTKSQRNYPITKKELWAVVFCVTKFHDWPAGRHFVIETDHQALTHLFKGEHENVVLNSWCTFY